MVRLKFVFSLNVWRGVLKGCSPCGKQSMALAKGSPVVPFMYVLPRRSLNRKPGSPHPKAAPAIPFTLRTAEGRCPQRSLQPSGPRCSRRGPRPTGGCGPRRPTAPPFPFSRPTSSRRHCCPAWSRCPHPPLCVYSSISFGPADRGARRGARRPS